MFDLTFNYTVGATSAGSLNIGVNVVQEPTANFAPYPVYAEMTSDGNYARPSFFNYDDQTNNTNPPIDQALRSSMCYWDTGDTGQFRNTKVPHATFRSKSRLDGPYMGFVYDTPGTYTLRAHKFDPDGSYGASAGTTITVVDPTDHFSAAQTVLVAPDGDFTGAPHESDAAVEKFTSLNAARNRIANAAFDKSNGFRLCIKRGQTYSDLTNSFLQEWAEDVSLIDSFGAGAMPLIEVGGIGSGFDDSFLKQDNTATSKSWRVHNVNFSGNWRSEYSMPKNTAGPYQHAMFMPLYRAHTHGLMMETFCNVTVQDCRFAFSRVSQSSGTASDKSDAEKGYLFLQDCTFKDMGDYICFGHGRAMGTFMLGCDGVPDSNSCLGSMARDGMPEYYPLNSHNALRGGWGILGLWSCFTSERHGWSGNQGGGSTLVSAQQVVRHSGQNRMRAIFSGCLMETSSGSIFGFSGNNGRLVQVLFDKCIALLAVNRQSSGGYFATSFQPGSIARNCLFIRSAVPTVSPGNFPTRNFDRFTGVGGWNDDPLEGFHVFRVANGTLPTALDPNRNVADGAILNCQLVDLKAAADGAANDIAWVNGQTAPQFTVTEKNSFIYAPNLSTPVNGGLSINNTALAHHTSQQGASRWSWELVEWVTGFSAIASTGTDTVDYPNDWYGNATAAADYAGAYSNPRHTLHFRNLRFIRYTGATAAFTVGATLSINGSSAGLIEGVTDLGGGTGVVIFNGGLTGGNGAAVTDTGGGSATASQPTRPMRFTPYTGGAKPNDVLPQTMTVTFGASNITIQNNTDFDWPATDNVTLVLDRGSSLMAVDEATRVPAGTLSEYRLNSAIAPETVDERDIVLEDLGRNLRPGTQHPNAPTGNDSQGPWAV